MRERASAGVAPSQDDLVAGLLEICSDALQIDDVEPDDDLFDLGGHSLTITRISGRIHRRYGVELPLEVFFDTPTAADIAKVLRASLEAGSSE